MNQQTLMKFDSHILAAECELWKLWDSVLISVGVI
jgi:hypothetical protein